jgi:hypothetical protein
LAYIEILLTSEWNAGGTSSISGLLKANLIRSTQTTTIERQNFNYALWVEANQMALRLEKTGGLKFPGI